MKRCLSALAIVLVVLYMALAIGAANCLVLHTDVPIPHPLDEVAVVAESSAGPNSAV